MAQGSSNSGRIGMARTKVRFVEGGGFSSESKGNPKSRKNPKAASKEALRSQRQERQDRNM